MLRGPLCGPLDDFVHLYNYINPSVVLIGCDANVTLMEDISIDDERLLRFPGCYSALGLRLVPWTKGTWSHRHYVTGATTLLDCVLIRETASDSQLAVHLDIDFASDHKLLTTDLTESIPRALPFFRRLPSGCAVDEKTFSERLDWCLPPPRTYASCPLLYHDALECNLPNHDRIKWRRSLAPVSFRGSHALNRTQKSPESNH